MSRSAKRHTTRLCGLLAAGCTFLAASVAIGAETSVYTWCGGSGDWTVSSNWKDGSGATLSGGYPNDKGAKVVFPSAGAAYEVTLPESVDAWRVTFESGANVTLSGGGQVTTDATGWNESVYNVFNGTVTLTNVTFKMKGCMIVRANLTLEEESHLYTPNELYLEQPGISLVINGGAHYVRHTNIEAPAPGAAMIVNGGRLGIGRPSEYTLTYDIYVGGDLNTIDDGRSGFEGNKVIVNGGEMDVYTAIAAGSEWRVLSGTAGFNGMNSFGGQIHIAAGAAIAYTAKDLRYWDSACLDFAQGSTLVWIGSAQIPSDAFRLPCNVIHGGTSAYAPLTAADETYVLPGALVATNATESGLAVNQDRGKICGLGSVVVSRLTQSVGTGYYSLTNIVIGNRLNVGSGSDAFFLSPVTLGSFGDWDSGFATYSSACLHFHDDVTVDTLDWFDRTSTHSVQLYCVQPEPGVALTVKGGGTMKYSTYNHGFSGGVNYKKLRPWRQVTVEAGTTLEIVNAKPLLCDKLIMGAGAKIKFAAGRSLIDARETEIDPTARFEATVSADDVTRDTPLLNGDFASVPSDAVVLTGLEGVSHTLKLANGCWYLDDGVEPEHSGDSEVPSYWTGKAGNGVWDDAGNWSSGTVPYSWNPWLYGGRNRYASFDGFRSLDVTYGSVKTTESWVTANFLETAGPFILRNMPGRPFSSWGLQVADGTKKLTTTNASYGTCSPFPIRVAGACVYYDEWTAYVADTPSYLEFTGGLTCVETKKGQLAVAGDVHFGGTNVMDTVNFGWASLINEQARETRLMLLPDSELTLRHNEAEWGAWFSSNFQRGVFDVRERSRLVFEKDGIYHFSSTRDDQCNYVAGEIDIRCPYLVRTKVSFMGPGHVHVAGTVGYGESATCRGETVIGRGLTLTCDGWDTAFDGSENYGNLAQGLTVGSGVAYLAATNDWTYGVRQGCVTATTVDQRALRIEADAELVIASTDACISFADPIRGPGKLTFAPGARIALGGAMAAKAESCRWTELATVGSWSGNPVLPMNYVLREMPAEGDLVTLQCRCQPGSVVIIR